MTVFGKTMYIANAVDTLRHIARKQDDDAAYQTLVEQSFYQQDQALLWGGPDKIVVTARPIEGFEWLTRTLKLPDVRNLSPRETTVDIFSDILRDETLLESVIQYAGEDGGINVIPHTSVPSLLRFQKEMMERFDLRIMLPETPNDLKLRDELDRKSGFRDYFAALPQPFDQVSIPRGRVCADAIEASSAVRRFVENGEACIAKADRGEASIGLTVFRTPADLVDLPNRLSENSFLAGDPIVVEEYIHGDDVFFPSIEYEISSDLTVAPRMTHVCEMLFDAPTALSGNVTSADFSSEGWYRKFEDAGFVIARDLQEKGYIGHFGMDAVARRGGKTYILEMNPRRTGSTHLDDFGRHFFGPDYGQSMTIGHFDFMLQERSFTLEDVLDLAGPLVASPHEKDSGVLPFEITGFPSGRLSFLIFAPSYREFKAFIEQIRQRLTGALDMRQHAKSPTDEIGL